MRPGRDRLSGTVEVDETFIGGEEAGLPGGRAKGKKSWSAWPSRSAAAGLRALPDGDPARRRPLVTPLPDPLRRAGRDGDHRRLESYHGIAGLGYAHVRRSQRAARARGEDPGKLLPGVHRVASLAKRWLLGTHQGSVEDKHLQSYLNEFCLRFNRRRPRSRGLVFYRVLELAVGHQPVRYRHLIAHPKHKAKPPEAPGQRGHPPSIERPRAARPWRTVHLG